MSRFPYRRYPFLLPRHEETMRFPRSSGYGSRHNHSGQRGDAPVPRRSANSGYLRVERLACLAESGTTIVSINEIPGTLAGKEVYHGPSVGLDRERLIGGVPRAVRKC